MTILEKKTYVFSGTFPSGKPITGIAIVGYSKKQAIRTFLSLFCRGKK